jgi:diguanylate cyclase (GGDEF)-like protein
VADDGSLWDRRPQPLLFMHPEFSPLHSEVSDEIAERETQYCAMVKLLAETLLSAVPGTHPAADNLKALASDMQGPVDTAQLKAHRTALSACAGPLQRELLKMRATGESGPEGQPADSATGLPGPGSAQYLIGSRLQEGQQTFAAVLVLDQLRALNARFGRNVGDEVLLQIAQELDGQLGDSGVLHRWRGPAFLVVCTQGKRQATRLEQQVRDMVAKRLEKTINVESRSIHVKITFTWQVQEVSAEEPVETAVRRFDDFVSSHTGTANAN